MVIKYMSVYTHAEVKHLHFGIYYTHLLKHNIEWNGLYRKILYDDISHISIFPKKFSVCPEVHCIQSIAIKMNDFVEDASVINGYFTCVSACQFINQNAVIVSN